MTLRTVLLVLSATFVLAQAPAPKPLKPLPAPPAQPAPPAPKPVKPAEVKPPVAGALVGNKNSKTFHKSDCKLAARMKEAHKVPFASRGEAEKQGYKACKSCLK